MRKNSWIGAVAASAALAGSITLVMNGTAAVAADEPPPIEEDFSYPGAAQILKDHGLKLFKGDGKILFVTSKNFGEGQCDPGQIQVEKALEIEPYGMYYCFKTVGSSGKGWLTLEVPATFGVRGGTKPLQATANLPQGDKKTYEIPANQHVPIEPGTGSEMPKAILVELRVTAAN